MKSNCCQAQLWVACGNAYNWQTLFSEIIGKQINSQTHTGLDKRMYTDNAGFDFCETKFC